jgi:CheY-like chemotaxis protein
MQKNYSLSVAIVDDETDLVKFLTMLLRKRGIPISFVAYDGNEAVEKFKYAEKKPNVILMDHHMRTLDGIEATKLILGFDADIKVIFLSADRHIRDKAIEAGACAFLNKPTGINEIVQAIKDCNE